VVLILARGFHMALFFGGGVLFGFLGFNHGLVTAPSPPQSSPGGRFVVILCFLLVLITDLWF
jgi:hypothetical protein